MKVFFFLLLAATFLFGQGDTTSSNSEYIIEEFTLPGGQLFNNVNCITEGPYGFLWFATHGGVVRYDGYEFVTFTANPADTIAPTTSLTFPYTEHLYWDKDDKLWVSSYGGGLFRFDPATETFDHFDYDEDDPTTISFPRVMWVQEDVDGKLWITTEHGINRFDRETETFKRYYPFEGPENLRDNTFRNIYLDKRGTLWISGGNAPWQSDISGLLKYDKSTDSFIKYVHDPNDPTTLSSSSTRGLLEDRNGNFWVGNSLGLQQMDRDQGTFTSYNYSESHPYAPGEESGINSIAFSLLEDQEGALWVGSMSQIDKPSNLLKYDPVTQTVTNFPLLRSAWDLHQSNDGTVWVAGAGISGKVTRIKPKSKIYELSKSPNYVEAYNQVRQEIQKGNRRLGRGFYSGIGPTSFGFDQTTGVMWGTHVGAYGTVVGGGEATPILSAYDPESKELSFYHLPELNLTRDNSLPGNIRGVTGLAVDQLGRVWSSGASENVGLFCFDPKTQKVVQYLHDSEDSTSLSSNFVIDIYQDPVRGDLYVSTYDQEINRVNPTTGQIKRLNLTNMDLLAYDNNPLTSTWHEGDIWIAGEIGSGEVEYMVKYNPDTEEKEWIPIPGLSPTAWIQDMDWTAGCEYIAFVSGDNGIGYIDPFNYQVNLLNTTNGLFPNDDTRAVLMTEDDIAVFSTEDGEYILHYPSGEIETIQKTNANRGRLGDGARAPDGKLYFNTVDGPWDVIDPAIIQSGASLDVANLALVDLYVLGEKQIPGKSNTLSQPLWITDKVSLPHTAENFSLRFTDFNYRGGNTSYLYRLYPYEDWHTTTGSPVANYYKIPAGDYEFQIKSIDSSNDADNTALSVELSILPPWWRTWWAYLGYVLLGGLSIGYFVKYQRDRAIHLERERIKDRELEQAKKLEVAYNKLKESEREAQIEAALERVRSRTMAMQHSNELAEASLVLDEQIRALGIRTRGCAFHIYGENDSTEWFSSVEGTMPVYRTPRENIFAEYYQAGQRGETLYIKEFAGEACTKHYEYLCTLPVMGESLNELIQSGGAFPDRQIDHATFFKYGYLLFITLDEVPESHHIFKRFAKVFEQTYTRFLDLQKAEAQAREAQIETALERVRAASMAMHQSSDLFATAEVLFKQIQQLGANLFSCGFALCREDTTVVEQWMYAIPVEVFNAHCLDHGQEPVHHELYKAWKTQKPIHSEWVRGETMDNMIQFLKKDPTIKENLEKVQSAGIGFPKEQKLHGVTFSHGYLLIITTEDFDESDIFVRFAKVFDQTYTRFLDLKKAEAQAREAQIEAALERVRARAMSMHQSQELSEVVAKLYKELSSMGMSALGFELILFKSGENIIEYWNNPASLDTAECYQVPRDLHSFTQKQWKEWEKKSDKFVLSLEGQEKKEFDNALFEKTDFKRWPEEIKEVIKQQESVTFSHAYIKYGFLEVIDSKPLSDDEFLILERFAKVFEQTYTRFLDLQKAESQAREAQIEAALERVRAASMAMHKSEDLKNVVSVLYKEIQPFGLATSVCTIHVFHKETQKTEVWAADGKDANHLESYFWYSREHPVIDQMWKEWEQKKESLDIHLEGDQKKDLDDYLLTKTDYKNYPKELRKEIRSSKEVYFSCVYFQKGFIASSDFQSPSQDQKDILFRFVRVFDRTYSRFLDLQKAEAQAKEAQIEAALERVRSRTMAMHRSEELNEVVGVLYQQFAQLTNNWGIELGIFNEPATTIEKFRSNIETAAFPKSYFIKGKGHRVLKQYWQIWEDQTPNALITLKGKAQKSFLQYLLTHTDFKELPESDKKAMEVPRVHLHFAPMRYGFIMVATLDAPFQQEDFSILNRFSKVFEQTYTRFLDIQKAEAQAKEAQIEAALERVRARSMAMHETSDLIEVSNVLYAEFRKLGFDQFYQCGFVIVDEKKEEQQFWGASTTDNRLLQFMTLPLLGDQVLHDRYQAWKKKAPYYAQVLPPTELKAHLDIAMPDQKITEKEAESKLDMPATSYFYFGNFSHGYLMFISGVEWKHMALETLTRFAKVFERTYTRFLDLQNAEAQAREARIEAALEKVRSAGMAMHSSDDLLTASKVLFSQLQATQLNAISCSITLVDQEKDAMELWVTHGNQFSIKKVKTTDHPNFKEEIETWKSGTEELKLINPKEEFIKAVKEIFNFNVVDRKDHDNIHLLHVRHQFGWITIGSWDETDSQEVEVIRRFAKVFEQTYTRFLDLQKAEAQAREAQIEAALERIRGRSMAMQSSNELIETAQLMFEQLTSLGIDPWICAFTIFREGTPIADNWASGKVGPLDKMILRHDEEPVLKSIYSDWKKGVSLHINKVEGLKLKKHMEYMLKIKAVEQSVEVLHEQGVSLPNVNIFHCANFKYGYILLGTLVEVPEFHDIFIRFAKAFEQTYTRFLDIRKAEAQAREAQIEAALERVRAASMAMHVTDDLKNVVEVLFEQFKKLDDQIIMAFVGIYHLEEKYIDQWFSPMEGVTDEATYVRFPTTPWEETSIKDWKAGKEITHYSVRGKEAVIQYAREVDAMTGFKGFEKFARERGGENFESTEFNHKYGTLSIVQTRKPTVEEIELVKRFGKSFEQCYVRFKDLQKAEVQAREAQIEAALERVRFQAMAMRKSEDLEVCTKTVFEELEKLNLTIQRSGIGIFDPDTKDCNLWTTVMNTSGEKELSTGVTSLTIHPMLTKTFDAWLLQESVSYTLEGRELVEYYKIISDGHFHLSEDVIATSSSLPKEYYFYTPFVAGGLYFFTDTEPLDSDKDILSRFAEVFHLTYTRFLDLQKAEAQAREAQIEAALERVRSTSLAMHNSNDLQKVIFIVFEQLRDLGIPLDVSFLQIFSKNDDTIIWVANPEHNHVQRVHIPYFKNPILDRVLQARQNQESFFSDEYSKEIKNKFYRKAFKNSDLSKIPSALQENILSRSGYFRSMALTKNTGLGIFSFEYNEYSTDENQLIHRFLKVFEQAYIRFLDIQKAEAQAREAQIEAALERVRAASMAMQNSEDSMDLVHVLFDQIKEVGIAIESSWITLVSADSSSLEFWVRHGDQIADAFIIDAQDHPNMQATLEAYNDGIDIIKIPNPKVDFIATAQEMFGFVVPDRADRSIFHLLQIRHRYGYIGLGTWDEPTDNETNLCRRFAKVFEQTYTRLLDLKRAEAQARAIREERDRLDATLSELQATQAQLIQSEKMASLGELTAGIAHEIQNPLNFVNNFSDVSAELIDEAIEELETDPEEAKEILADLKQNLEKINHHGQRAESIVKGMLQHSRSGAGEKVPTDINALCDEYMRLAYHGLRAKDQSFNADYDLQLDDKIAKIDVVPQDMSRVILNIVTNAFQACHELSLEKKDTAYAPKVACTTTLSPLPWRQAGLREPEDGITITISDNGPGIPQDIIDKVFQPFFTTKPTGQGTGLGLSMAYDIVKAHGGTLEVDSQTEVGTTFIIELPITR